MIYLRTFSGHNSCAKRLQKKQKFVNSLSFDDPQKQQSKKSKKTQPEEKLFYKKNAKQSLAPK